jgi:hypothetical protein
MGYRFDEQLAMMARRFSAVNCYQREKYPVGEHRSERTVSKEGFVRSEIRLLCC